jgi:SsrA-binding protein
MMSGQASPRAPAPPPERVSVARNPKATHDFHVLDTMEAGLVLTGTEVKSLRRRGASIKEAFARVSRGEIWVEKLNITPYEQGNRYNHDPIRARKLLLHRREIEKLIGAVERDGLALIPLELYFLRGRAKLLLALAKGKKAHDKREDLKRREADREVARAMAWRGRK